MFKKKRKRKREVYNLPFPVKTRIRKVIRTIVPKLKFVFRKEYLVDNIGLEKIQTSSPWYYSKWNMAWGTKNLKEILNALQKKKQKTYLSYLKKDLNTKSKLDARFFKPWRYEIPFLTTKQSWLNDRYVFFKSLPLRKRKDFFQTQVGQMMVASSFSFPMNDYILTKNEQQLYFMPMAKISNILSRSTLSYSTRQEGHWCWYEYHSRNFVSRKKIYSDLRNRNEKSWFYENTLRPRGSVLFSKFKLTKFETAFHSNYREVKKRPWVEPLFFKRTALSAFEERYRKANKFEGEKLQYKFYLRNKNPRHIKRNRLYKRNIKLTANPWKSRRIMAHQTARIKQILSKLLRPFYGHLTLRQWTILVKKSKKKKSRYQTRAERILQHLENRLDVVVYRLNWAPSIMWARRLIYGGFIFVSNIKKTNMWSQMYSCLKKYSFPLKLRDPKNLYRKTFWNPKKRKTKQKFFYFPQKKINYLVQPGDMLQCSRSILMNQFKNNAILLKKPLSSRFLSGRRRSRTEWRWDRHQIIEKSFNVFESCTEHKKSAVVLSKAKFKHLPKSDRSNKFFLRWVIA